MKKSVVTATKGSTEFRFFMTIKISFQNRKI
jgi:hypothetical protein